MTSEENAARDVPTTPYPSPPRGSAPRWLVLLVSVVALLAVIAAVAVVVVPRPPLSTSPVSGKPITPAPTSPLALDPAAYGMACVSGAAWSTDSAKIAILGTLHGCAESTPDAYYPTIVAIANAEDGRLLASLQPDAVVFRQFHLQAPRDGATITGPDDPGVAGGLIQPGILYHGPVWSPDGKSIALPFMFAYMAASPADGPPPTQRITVSGLYVGAAGGASDGLGAKAFGVTLSQQLGYVAEWNVRTGNPVVASSLGPPIHAGTVAQLEPASLSYSWRPDGSLSGSGALAATLPSASVPLGPVGNPDGGTSFTVWQGMTVQVNVGDPQHPQRAATFMANVDFLAWSPDGAYVMSASYDWRTQPSKQIIPTTTQLQREGAADLPLLPIRDAAMEAMLSPEPGDHAYTFVSNRFTWSPNGKLLAAIANGGATIISADVTVLIADCASGKTLARLQVGNTSTAYGNIASLQWSPDGKRLLIGAESEYYVVGPGQLPQT